MAITRLYELDSETGVMEIASGVDVTAVGGVTDHGALTGLSDDDHLQYLHNTPGTSLRNVIVAGASGVIPLIVFGHTASVVDLFDIYKGGTIKCFADSNGKWFGFGLDARSEKLTNLAAPTTGSDGTNKTFVDAGDAATLVTANAYTDSAAAAVTAYVDGLLFSVDHGDISIDGAGTWTIDNDVVTYAKMQNISAASRLLGRGSAGGPGDTQELDTGSGVMISGTTLQLRALISIPFSLARQPFTNIAAATTEYGANQPFRIKYDFTNVVQIRIQCRVIVVGASGSATLLFQYSTDESSWSTLTTNTIALCTGSAGSRVTTFEDLPVGAAGEVFVRWVTTGGDAGADPEIGNLYLQVR